MKIEHKCIPFEVKSVADPGEESPGYDFDGIGGCFLNLDSTNDVIAPGAFADDLAKFLSDGFIGGLNHNWDAPIGHPIEAKETPHGLYFKAVLDNTPDAQAIRAKMKVNPLSGRATIKKLSIGYRTVASEKFANADAVKAYWATHKYSPDAHDEVQLKSAFTPRRDPATGKEVTPGARLIKKLTLFEVSPVSVPANHRADIIGAKFYGDHPMAMGGRSSGAPDPDALLGDTDEILAWGALARLHDLLCMALHGILSNEMVPVADRLSTIGQAIDQFRASLLDVLTYFLSGDDPAEPATQQGMAVAVETMSRQFKARFGMPTGTSDPGRFADELAAATAPGFSDQSRSVVSAVEGFVERAEARLDARLKDGRELSAANRAALMDVHAGLMGHAEAIHGMLARTTKPVKDAEEAPVAIASGKAADVPAETAATTPDPAEPAVAEEVKDAEVVAEVVQPPAEAKADRVDPEMVKGLFAKYLSDIEAPFWASDTTNQDQ